MRVFPLFIFHEFIDITKIAKIIPSRKNHLYSIQDSGLFKNVFRQFSLYFLMFFCLLINLVCWLTDVGWSDRFSSGWCDRWTRGREVHNFVLTGRKLTWRFSQVINIALFKMWIIIIVHVWKCKTFLNFSLQLYFLILPWFYLRLCRSATLWVWIPLMVRSTRYIIMW